MDNTGKLDFMRSLGADHVIDYTREDFTKNGNQYDLILDLVAHRSVFAYQRALRPNGSYFMVGGSVATIFQILLLGPWMRRTTGKNIRLLAVQPNLKDMVYITELYEAGKVVPVIDRRYPLSEVPEALRYLGEGHARGKLVITVDQMVNSVNVRRFLRCNRGNRRETEESIRKTPGETAPHLGYQHGMW